MNMFFVAGIGASTDTLIAIAAVVVIIVGVLWVIGRRG